MSKFSISPDSTASVIAKIIAGAAFVGAAAGIAIHVALTIGRRLPVEWSMLLRNLVASVGGMGALISSFVLVDVVVSSIARKRWALLKALLATHAKFDAMMKAWRDEAKR